MNKQDFMKLQTCVLKVNIPCACEGCSQKIKKLLNKIDGVYKTSIDLEQGKVTVYGNANPATLIKELNKSGKHAELWGPQRGQVNLLNNQFKNMGLDNKNHKGGYGGKDNQKDGKGYQQMQTINKGFKDINKDQKSIKFNMPARGGFDSEDDLDDDSDFDDDFDDEDDDDDSYDGYDDKKPNKMMTGPKVGGYGPRGPNAMMNGMKGANAGFELPTQFKVKGGNNDAKKGDNWKKGGGRNGGDSKGGKISKNGGSKNGGFFGGKIGRALFGDGKKKQSVSSSKGGKKGGGVGGDWEQKGGSWDKKGGKHNNEGKFGSSNKQNEFPGFSKAQNGGGGQYMGHNGGYNGQNISRMDGKPMMARMENRPMSQMSGYPMGQMSSGQGFPMAYGGQGMDHGNPYNQQPYQQQQYMQGMMMMNQHRPNMYPQMMYGQPPPSAFGPPPGNDNMSHIFSDENTEGCSIM